MKKYTLLFMLMMLSLGLATHSMAQCTPDPNCTDPEGDGEYCPKDYPNAVENIYYDEVSTIICPTSAQGQSVHHIRLIDIENIPAGINFQCQDGDCNFYAGVGRCVNVYGTPEPGSWGYYKLHVRIEAFIDLFGNPVSVGEFVDSSTTIYVEPYLHSDFEINASDTLCYHQDYAITYTGNAESTATYHWDFGSHATVVSGEGQGPYTIRYDTPFTLNRGLDSITLYVEQDEFISPVSSQTFAVEECLGVDDMTASTVSLVPNPCSNTLHISTLYPDAVLRIYTISGQLVHQEHLSENTTAIEVSSWQSGMYLAKIDTQHTTLIKKFIKQ